MMGVGKPSQFLHSALWRLSAVVPGKRSHQPRQRRQPGARHRGVHRLAQRHDEDLKTLGVVQGLAGPIPLLDAAGGSGWQTGPMSTARRMTISAAMAARAPWGRGVGRDQALAHDLRLESA